VLAKDAVDFVRAEYHPVQAVGAIQGQQNRAWVMCCVPTIAIIADTSSLSLPAGVEGLAGLTFLRPFAKWGAERSAAGWRFFLSDEV
jgi:hypothetical protein